MAIDPLGLIGSSGGVNPAGPLQGPGKSAAGGPAQDPNAPKFIDLLNENLKSVNKLQQDATKAIEDLQTGKRDDLEGVMIATQKADTAFRMLLATRNKVLDAYEEIKQIRV
jgi:flagellar hook-basal body complex protein FliE